MDMFKGASRGKSVCSLGASELPCYFLQTMWFCWLYKIVISSMHWVSLQLNGKTVRIFKSDAWFLFQKKGGLLPLGWELITA